MSAAAHKNLEQSGSIYHSVLHYKIRQPKPAPAELGPAGLTVNEPDPLELLTMTKTEFIAGRIARVYQKDLSLEPRS